MNSNRDKPIPEKKVKEVKELDNLIKNKNTILVSSIKNIPASQFQEISKNLRDEVVIKVPKKNLIFRAIDKQSEEEVKKIKENLGESFAVLFSDLDSFKLAKRLLRSQCSVGAKPGQEAPEDIEVPEGPTNLVPGPAISDLGSLGIKFKIEKGKINIEEPKVIVKKGEKISATVASMLSKLEIKPLKIGFIPLCAYDRDDNKFYTEIKIDFEGTLESLKESYSKSLALAVEIGYTTQETVKVMIQKASAYEGKLKRVITGEPEPTEEAPEEEKKEQEEKPKKEDKKESEADAGAGLASLFG